MIDPPVHRHKTTLMQRLLDSVVRGYWWHTGGVVPVDRAGHLASKFAQRYGAFRNANARAYGRRHGQASVRLFLLPSPDSTDLQWWLCATDGTGRVHSDESLGDARERRQRIRIGADYELVRRTRPRTRGGGTVWSWRMTRECYARWRERIIAACRRRTSLEVKQAIHSLSRTPGFGGIREQVGKLIALARSEWRRRHGTLDALQFPRVLPYVERLPDTTVPLSDWWATKGLWGPTT